MSSFIHQPPHEAAEHGDEQEASDEEESHSKLVHADPPCFLPEGEWKQIGSAAHDDQDHSAVDVASVHEAESEEDDGPENQRVKHRKPP